MRWHLSHRADKAALPLADRHYSRQKPGTPKFGQPGRSIAFIAPNREDPKALWLSSWPFARYVNHAWAGAWQNTLFRNEGAGLSSDLITEAVAATLYIWPEPPDLGMASFIDASKIKHKRDPGRCYKKAGWKHVGFTKAGLWVYQVLPVDMPSAEAPLEDAKVKSLAKTVAHYVKTTRSSVSG